MREAMAGGPEASEWTDGWAWLRRFWGFVLTATLLGLGTLAYLGPPPPREAAAQPPAVVTPAALPDAAAPVVPATAEAQAATLTDLQDPAPPQNQGQPGPIPPPDPQLLEATHLGALPRVAPDGRTSIRTYGRAFARGEKRPRIAIVVGGLGLHAGLSDEAIRRLPPTTGLAFSPYAQNIQPLLNRARARGMEMLVALPMEPAGYPSNDPGPRALLTTLPAAENAERLRWVLTRMQGYVGAVGALGGMRGERFAQAPELLAGVQDVLRDRGLLYLDPRPEATNSNRAWGRTADVVIDEPATREGVERRLQELERVAKEWGSALGVAGDASPVLLDRITSWATGLEQRGIVLAPVTAILRRPEIPQKETATR
ncbi:divergent polysaccharide deacetylase family protein [Roseomonas gilardii subsp. gilardii]|uniref:divergent polysaccharide deacetylase family protein n=1 Tax=Roseomonas gilardii TaxID=257708 RepID=UPI001FF7BD42|nr:divergent polysaccharide deacetylase family protein [Roseomonas gilardii]UPG72780.1 divergent polysaccharide deacetylase family protein [Roseomonas gilardii subsp. gilardii]